jgi:hypothetical protein
MSSTRTVTIFPFTLAWYSPPTLISLFFIVRSLVELHGEGTSPAPRRRTIIPFGALFS